MSDLAFPTDEAMAKAVVNHFDEWNQNQTHAADNAFRDGKKGVPRETFKHWVKQARNILQCNISPPKVLIFDVEISTTQITIEQYGLKVFKKYLDPKDIIRDWIMLGAAWKWLDEPHVYCVSVSSKNPIDDTEVVSSLYQAIDEADIIIGHNSDKFDIKKIKTKAFLYGHKPLGKKKTIDTLKIARSEFSFSSNKLSHLAEECQVTCKAESPDWEKALQGCPKELAYMRKYNRLDVQVTEEIYLKLRGWMKSHPNFNAFYDIKDSEGRKVDVCPSCASANTVEKGVEVTAAGRYKTYQCEECGYVMRHSKNLTKVSLK